MYKVIERRDLGEKPSRWSINLNNPAGSVMLDVGCWMLELVELALSRFLGAKWR